MHNPYANSSPTPSSQWLGMRWGSSYEAYEAFHKWKSPEQQVAEKRYGICICLGSWACLRVT